MLVETKVGRLFVEVTGDGPDLVLWHSLLCDGGMWRGQVGPLSEHYRVINIDGPGHGRSARLRRAFTMDECVDAALSVMDALGAERVLFCGLSWGGMVGMRLAARHPERVAALCLLDTNARAERPLKKFVYTALAAVARTVGPLRPLGGLIVPIFFASGTRRRHPEVIERFLDGIAAMDRATLGHVVDAVMSDREDVTAELGHIEAPTLVLVGARDRATPAAEADIIARLVPDSEQVTIPDAAHLSALEQPEKVNAALLAFFERHAAAASIRPAASSSMPAPA